MPKEDEELDPIIVADLEEDEEIDPIIVAGLDEDGQKDQEEEHTREEEPPQSPREEEKGNLPYAYTPRSPPYPHLKMMTGKLKVFLDWSLQTRTKTL